MIVIPASYSKHRDCFSWEQIHWAYNNGIIDWRYLVEKAVDRLQRGSDNADEVELASLSNADAGTAGEIINKITSGSSDESAKQSWLCVLLSWLYEQKDEIANPLKVVESLYADFGYPKEIAPFIRYMPPQDGYDPTKHNREANIMRLFDKWKQYVEVC